MALSGAKINQIFYFRFFVFERGRGLVNSNFTVNPDSPNNETPNKVVKTHGNNLRTNKAKTTSSCFIYISKRIGKYKQYIV